MTSEEAREKGVSRPTLWEMHDRLRKNPKKFNWTTKAVRKLLS